MAIVISFLNSSLIYAKSVINMRFGASGYFIKISALSLFLYSLYIYKINNVTRKAFSSLVVI
jgi:hypothetical protein